MAEEKTELNHHNDHLASCLCCAHLRVVDGSPEYGDATPGSESTVDCAEGVIEFDSHLWLRASFRLFHEWGPYCPLFKPKEETTTDIDFGSL